MTIELSRREMILAKRLLNLARHRQLTTYSYEASQISPPMLARHPSFCKMLDRIGTYTYQKYGVFLPAIVKHKSSNTIGLGFFNAVYRCMKMAEVQDKILLQASWDEHFTFWQKELHKLYEKAFDVEIISFESRDVIK